MTHCIIQFNLSISTLFLCCPASGKFSVADNPRNSLFLQNLWHGHFSSFLLLHVIMHKDDRRNIAQSFLSLEMAFANWRYPYLRACIAWKSICTEVKELLIYFVNRLISGIWQNKNLATATQLCLVQYQMPLSRVYELKFALSRCCVEECFVTAIGSDGRWIASVSFSAQTTSKWNENKLTKLKERHQKHIFHTFITK